MKLGVKKKGFTLVELLVILVILTIIAIITIPIVRNIINESEEKANVSSSYGVIKAADYYYASGFSNKNVRNKFNGSTNVLSNLELDGKSPDRGYVYINSEGKIAIALKYGDKCYKKGYNQKEIESLEYDVNNCRANSKPTSTLTVSEYQPDSYDYFLGLPIEREQIRKIEFVNNINIPNGYQSYDVSDDNDGTVMAWYKNNDWYHDIYIGGIDGVQGNPNSSYLFASLYNLEEINLEHFYTDNVVDMSHMFSAVHYENVSEVFIETGKKSIVNTNSNIVTPPLTNLNIKKDENYKLEKISISYYYMLENLDLSNFNTSKVTNMEFMFWGLSQLINLNISSFDTSKVTNMRGMFAGMSSLTSLNLSHFNTSKVTDMSGMFTQMYMLNNLNISSFDTSNVTNMSYMFSMGYFEYEYEGNTPCSFIEKGKKDIINLNNNTFNSSLSNLNIKKDNNYKIEKIGSGGPSSHLKNLDLSHFDTSNVIDMSGMFRDLSELTNLNISHFNTSNVTYMIGMFSGMDSLTNLNISHFDTSNVIDMSGMFSNMYDLTILNINNFNTSNVIYMTGMFYECESLTNLNLSHFNTSNVTSMYGMFTGMYNLTNLNISNFNTSNVTDMDSMFLGLTNITNLNLSHFNTSNVTDMYYMFAGMSGLTSLDLRNANFNLVTRFDFIFYEVPISTTIYVKDNAAKTFVQNNFEGTNILIP